MYEYRTRVTTSASNPDGRQSFMSILTMLQDCSLLWLDSEPVMTRYLEEENAAMILGSRQLEVCRRARMGEDLRVVTSIFSCNKWLGYRNTCIYDADGAAVAKSRCVGVFVNRETGKPQRLTQEVVDSLVYDDEVPVDCSRKKLRPPETEPRDLGSLQARFSDIDFNGHVNNAQYVRMAIDLAPELAAANRLRIEYRRAAHEGDVLSGRLWDCDGESFVELAADDGTPYAVMAFQR